MFILITKHKDADVVFMHENVPLTHISISFAFQLAILICYNHHILCITFIEYVTLIYNNESSHRVLVRPSGFPNNILRPERHVCHKESSPDIKIVPAPLPRGSHAYSWF